MIRRAALRPSQSRQKRYCVRGHDTFKGGIYWNRNTQHDGVIYLTRRCRLCAIDDSTRCQARKKMGAV